MCRVHGPGVLSVWSITLVNLDVYVLMLLNLHWTGLVCLEHVFDCSLHVGVSTHQSS
jgi:hypothetical protein